MTREIVPSLVTSQTSVSNVRTAPFAFRTARNVCHGEQRGFTRPGVASLRFHGEAYGWEAELLCEGELVIGRRFDLRRLAEQWAEEERKLLAR